MEQPRLIFSAPFPKIKDSVVDLSLVATPCHHRLIDANAFLNDHRLDIHEYPLGLTSDPYVAISYVWRGNPVVTDPSDPSQWIEELGIFNVKGAEDGDPISLDVLFHICSTALSCDYSGSYLWLDRLCIIQSSKEDKAWQIRQMHDIYKHSRICCILPGGMQRLVSLDEETTWISRAWTLQEVLLPRRVLVLFLADEDCLERIDTVIEECARPFSCMVERVSAVSAYCELRSLLQLSIAAATNSSTFPISIFGRKRAPIIALYSALVQQNSHAYVEKDMRMQMIWRCALMRTSSRPVDMVFSIMGLLGVDLDPLQYNSNDRLKATIALARNSLSSSEGKANWLAVAYPLEPCRQLSSFPLFPESSVDGQAFYDIASLIPSCRLPTNDRKLVADVVEEKCDNGWLHGLPKAMMDENGYLTFRSKIVDLVSVSMDPTESLVATTRYLLSGHIVTKDYIRAGNGSVWRVHDGKRAQESSTSHTMAVLLGTRMDTDLEDFFGETPESDDDDDDDDDHLDWRERWSPESLRRYRTDIALLVKEHNPGKFHRVSYLELKGGFDNIFKTFTEASIALGGPDR